MLPPPMRGPEPVAPPQMAGATAHALERFQEKWAPVFRPEPRQNKESEHFRDSEKRENVPGPAIAICIDDLGANRPGTLRAIALPHQVALAFFPFAPATPRLAEAAERAGHDVLAHVPMQTLEPVAPSPMTLTVDAPDNVARLEWNIARVPGLIGVNNHQGSRFTEDAAALEPVMQALAARHLFFFDSRTAPGTVAVAVARRHDLLSAGRDVFLDNVEEDAAVRRQLDRLMAIARRRGVAIAIGHPHDVTLAVLASWLKEDHGVRLVTLPEAMRMKEGDALAER